MARDFNLPGRSTVYATGGMAATSMPVATLTALDVMRAGGNALDAAIAAAAVLGVVEPQSTGIGGDCFCLYAPAGEAGVIALNGSGRAPRGLTPEALRRSGVTRLENTSVHSVTVPGAVSAWQTLHDALGRADWGGLFQPAIRMAERGWPVHPRVARDWADAVGKLKANAAAGRRFLKQGMAPSVGDLFVQPELAATLRIIAEAGAAGFYSGPVADDLVASLGALGGFHTHGDFLEGATAAEFVKPISMRWRGMDIVQCPPNGSGLLVLMLLGILDGFDTPPGGPLSPLRLHRHVEAARLAYRDRDAFLGDPERCEVPVARLTSPSYLDGLRGLIDDGRAMPELPPAGASEWLPRHRDTVYVAVVDGEGNACSFINSLFQNFGSGILAEKSGVMLQNRGFGFSLQEGHPNQVGPGKRPMHTIIPGMVTQDGRAVMPYGVMGGHFQPMGQTLLLTNHFLYGLDLQEALDLPRLFPLGGRVEVETGMPPSVIEALARLGHAMSPAEAPLGGGQAILIDHRRGCLIAGSDPRKDGCAMGF